MRKCSPLCSCLLDAGHFANPHKLQSLRFSPTHHKFLCCRGVSIYSESSHEKIKIKNLKDQYNIFRLKFVN